MIVVTEINSFSVAEVAYLFNVSPATVRRWISEGKLRASREGRRLCIHREDLRAFAPGVLPEKGYPWKTPRATPEEREALWKDYDPAKVIETLDRMSGTLPEEAERMLAFLAAKRRKYD